MVFGCLLGEELQRDKDREATHIDLEVLNWRIPVRSSGPAEGDRVNFFEQGLIREEVNSSVVFSHAGDVAFGLLKPMVHLDFIVD